LDEGCLVTLVDLVSAALSGPDRPVLYERAADGRWSALGTTDVLARVTAIAATLRDRGLAPGDRVALMSPNRVDWILANLGILFAGGVTVPIYATQAADQVRFIIADSGARELFVDTPRRRRTLCAPRASRSNRSCSTRRPKTPIR
jgi:long-chain acyl-CoA synthetase